MKNLGKLDKLKNPHKKFIKKKVGPKVLGPTFNFKDSSQKQILDHFMELASGNPKNADRFLVSAMRPLDKNSEEYKKAYSVHHYFQYVLIEPKVEDHKMPGDSWEVFETLLKNHDWFYSFKDGDRDYFREQSANASKINVMYENLQKRDKQKADEIYNKYYKEVKPSVIRLETPKKSKEEIQKNIDGLLDLIEKEKAKKSPVAIKIKTFEKRIDELKKQLEE